ncbi:MAG: NUDIX domain-containing protein [Nanoarchaeota archaeon]
MKYGTMSYLFVDKQILMIKKIKRENDPNSGFYTLPGGKLKDFEKGLNPNGRLESAIRETEEETGLKLIEPKLKGVILFDNSERIFDNWKNSQDFLVYLFEAEKYSGKLKEESNEGIPVWIDEKLLEEIPKNEGDLKIYEWLKDPRYFIGTIYHKEKKLDKIKTFVDYF